MSRVDRWRVFNDLKRGWRAMFLLAIGGLLVLVVTFANQARRARPEPVATVQTRQLPVLPGLSLLEFPEMFPELQDMGFRHMVHGPAGYGDVDLYGLTRAGVTCQVQIFRNPLRGVTTVLGSVMVGTHAEPDDVELARTILGMVGSIPVDGADTESNRTWVEAHFEGGEDLRQGVTFAVELRGKHAEQRILRVMPAD